MNEQANTIYQKFRTSHQAALRLELICYPHKRQRKTVSYGGITMSQKVKIEEKIRMGKDCISGRISQKEAELLTGVSRTVVADWIRLYENEGVSAFLPKKGNRLLQ